MLVMNLCTGVLSVITAPKLGHLSDRYGRKKLLALASCGGLLGELVTVLAAKFPKSIDYRFLILGSLFDGLTGSMTAGGILAQAYTSDCTPPSKRSVSIGYLHACLFTGIALGPLLTGYFVEWTGSLVSIFYVVMGCHMFFILFVAFVIPESLSKKKRLAAQEKWEKDKASREGTPAGHWLLSGFTTFFAPLKCLMPTGRGTSPRLRLNLIALGINDFIIMGLSMAAGQITMLYAEYTFDWGTLETSRFVSALMFIRVIVLMGIFPIINYIFRVRPARRRSQASGVPMVDKNSGADTLDVWVLRVSLASDMIGVLFYFLARSPALFFGGGMLTAFGGLGSATIQAVVTKHVPAERVGQMLGAIGMVHALARVIGPIIFNGLYAETVATFPQAVFLLLICLFGLAFICSFAIKPHGKSYFLVETRDSSLSSEIQHADLLSSALGRRRGRRDARASKRRGTSLPRGQPATSCG
jgi:MFS family permease